jgi:hypothetical protein
MKSYNIYFVFRESWFTHTGHSYELCHREYLTNNNGDGLFLMNKNGGLNQIVGNDHNFRSARSIVKFLKKDEDALIFPTKIGALRVLNRLKRENPLKERSIVHLEIGKIYSCYIYSFADKFKLIGQNGEQCTVQYNIEEQIRTEKVSCHLLY